MSKSKEKATKSAPPVKEPVAKVTWENGVTETIKGEDAIEAAKANPKLRTIERM